MVYYQVLLALFCYLWVWIPDVLQDIHMLQLSGYRTERYARWMAQDLTRFVHLRQLWVLLAAALFLTDYSSWFFIAWSVISLYLFATRKKVAQKKKLAITARVMRLMGVHFVFVLSILCFLSGFIQRNIVDSDTVPVFTLFALGFLNPLFLIASLNLTRPMEYGVGLYYRLDAQKILKSHSDLKLIGITGSYGKTSTKLAVQQLLSTRFNSLTTPQSYNTPMGVVLAIRTLLRPIHQMFVVEMGARQPGDIKELCDLVHPHHGVITAIGEQHLETFGQIEKILATKLELFDALPAGGMAFYNADDSLLQQIQKRADLRYLGFGIDSECDYRAFDMRMHSGGTEFSVSDKKGEIVRFRTRLLGRHNIYNVLAGISLGSELGIPMAELVPAVATLSPVAHRLEVRKTQAGVTILDDAFSSNPVGARYALEVLQSLEGSRKVLITPGMVELGIREFELNKAFGKQAASVCDQVVLVGPKRAIPIKEGLIEAGFAEDRIYIAADLRDGQGFLSAFLKAGDVVLYENDLPDNYNEVKV